MLNNINKHIITQYLTIYNNISLCHHPKWHDRFFILKKKIPELHFIVRKYSFIQMFVGSYVFAFKTFDAVEVYDDGYISKLGT